MKPAYYHTFFQVFPEELPSSFCIVTAWNPDGQSDLPGRNQQRDQALAERLDELSLPRVRITGMSPDESHAEPGWAIACSLDRGLELGREFKQEGIYQVIEGELLLANGATGEATSLGPFAPRVRDPRKRRLFTVHVGAPEPRARFSPTETLEIRLRAAKRFASFTITETEGCYRNQTEDVLLISFATEQYDEVLDLAKDLLVLLRLDGIGVSHHGIYQRVTAWSEPEFLLKAFGLAVAPQGSPH
jgi:hypothetical protein